MDLPLGVFGGLYALGGLLTFGFVIKWGSTRLPKWLKAMRPESAEDWVFAPFLGVLGVAMVAVALWFTVAAWPAVALVGYQERRRSRALRSAEIDREDQELLRELRSLKSLGGGE